MATVDALVAQPLDVGALGLIGALHRIAEVDQHLGDAAHADAADADEMHRADVARQFHVKLPSLVCQTAAQNLLGLRRSPPPSAPGRRAGRRHRAGRRIAPPPPCRRAAPARRPARRSRSASRRGVKSSCTSRIAPPARSSTPALANWSWSSACGSGTRIDGPADGRKFGDCRGAGPRHDQMARRHARRQIGERTAPTSAATRKLGVGVADARQILLARLLHDRQAARAGQVRAARSPQARYRP